MKYRLDRHGEKLSILGYGCMRFTRKGTSIDIDKAEKEIMAAFKAVVGQLYERRPKVIAACETVLAEL